MNGAYESHEGQDGEGDDDRGRAAEGRRDRDSEGYDEGARDTGQPADGRAEVPPSDPVAEPPSRSAEGPAEGPEPGTGRPGPESESESGQGAAELPRIPPPRRPAEDGDWPGETPSPSTPPVAEPDAQQDGVARPPAEGHHPAPATDGAGSPGGSDVPRGSEEPDEPGGPDDAAAYGPPRDGRQAPSGQLESAAEPKLEHHVLKSLLGAWALAATAPAETAALERHLADCGTCADEALRLRDAVALLHPEESLDLDPMLRSRVLSGCLDRRPAQVPIPAWAVPYDTETARLAALLHDMAEAEWRTPVRLRWFAGEKPTERETTVAGVIEHLLAVDGLLTAPLGLADPLRRPVASGGQPAVPEAPSPSDGPAGRTEALWRARRDPSPGPEARLPWRDQGRELVRTVSFADAAAAGLQVPYGDFTLPLQDAFLDRAFECWVHAGDIAEAVDYPYDLPAVPHLRLMVDFAARQLPGTLARRRRSGLAAPARLSAVDSPGRTLHLEVEGAGGGDWYIPLDSPGARAGPEAAVAHVALDRAEFCQLAAGHVAPGEAAAGQEGDREAIREVLYATAALSRL